MSNYEKVRLAVSHGADIHFEGMLVREYTTQNRAGTKNRWTELRLWKTRGGNHVAEGVGCSAINGEGEIRAAAAIYDENALVREAMTVWGWTTAAKAFARELGWDVIERVL